MKGEGRKGEERMVVICSIAQKGIKENRNSPKETTNINKSNNNYSI